MKLHHFSETYVRTKPLQEAFYFFKDAPLFSEEAFRFAPQTGWKSVPIVGTHFKDITMYRSICSRILCYKYGVLA